MTARALLLVIATLFSLGSGKKSASLIAQERYVRDELMPSPSMPPGRVAPRVTPMRLRLWVEAGYKSVTPRWQERFEEQLERINGILASHYGVAFEVVEIRDWTPAGGALTELIYDLQTVDLGDDVDWVVGLARPERLVTSAYDKLGVALPLTKYFVVRGMSDADERRAFEEALPDLEAEDLEETYRARKAHKEMTVFLHEWAHTLGALHSTHESDWMSTRYAPHARGFNPGNRGIIRLGVKHRRAVDWDLRTHATELHQYLLEAGEAEWWSAERERFIDHLAQVVR